MAANPTPYEIKEYLQNLGYSDIAASGIAGNLMQESGFNTSAVGDGGMSQGVAQWNNQRLINLQQFAQSLNADWKDWRTQLNFIAEEMNPNSQYADSGAVRAGRLLANAQTPQEAAVAFTHFERPQGYNSADPSNSHGLENRINFASAIFNNQDLKTVSSKNDSFSQVGGMGVNHTYGRSSQYGKRYSANNYGSFGAVDYGINNNQNGQPRNLNPLQNYSGFGIDNTQFKMPSFSDYK